MERIINAIEQLKIKTNPNKSGNICVQVPKMAYRHRNLTGVEQTRKSETKNRQ